MHYRFFLLLVLFCSISLLDLQGQQLELIKSLPLKNIQQISVDRYQQLYAITGTGTVYQLDSIGKELVVYSPPQNNQIDLIASWQAIQIFLFYEELQSFKLCDRFLGNCLQYSLEEEELGYITNATLAADGRLWLFDQDDFSLKKYDFRLKQTILSNPINQLITEDDFNIQHLREYQNRLFVLSETFLYQFDLFGNLERKWEIGEVESFSFLDDQLYYLLGGNRLIIQHLYTAEQAEYQAKKQYNQLIPVNARYMLGLHSDGLDWLRVP